MEETKKKPPIREVVKLPKVAILNEVIFNKSDKCFYMGVETKTGVRKHGSRVEKTGV